MIETMVIMTFMIETIVRVAVQETIVTEEAIAEVVPAVVELRPDGKQFVSVKKQR